MYRTFAEMFRKALAEANLSQTAFSAKSGIKKNSVYRYVNGQQIPLEKRRIEIAIALGKPEDYFSECVAEKPIIKKLREEKQKKEQIIQDSKLKWGQVGGIGSKIKGVK